MATWVGGAVGLVLMATALYPWTGAEADAGGGVTVVSNSQGVATTVTASGAAGTRAPAASGTQEVTYAEGPGGTTCAISVDAGDTSLLPAGYDGAFWTLYCPTGTFIGAFAGGGGRFGFSPTTLSAVPSAAKAPATPAQLAQRAENLLPLPTPAAQHNPTQALTGLATWWWVNPAQWRPLSQRTAAGPVWAQVTARPVSSTWNAGDGSAPLTCNGPGTPYNPNEPASAQSSDCTHTYTRSSAGQPQTGPDSNDRYFTVTVTVRWAVSWVGSGGAAGALPPVSRTYSFPLQVAERETVMASGSG